MSARVGDFFKHKPKEVSTPAKVEEEQGKTDEAPKIDEPAPLAPLENPAAEGKKEEGAAPATEEAKPEETKTAEAAAPAVAATA